MVSSSELERATVFLLAGMPRTLAQRAERDGVARVAHGRNHMLPLGSGLAGNKVKRSGRQWQGEGFLRSRACPEAHAAIRSQRHPCYRLERRCIAMPPNRGSR